MPLKYWFHYVMKYSWTSKTAAGEKSEKMQWVEICFKYSHYVIVCPFYPRYAAQEKTTNKQQAGSIHLINQQKWTLLIYWHLVTLSVAGWFSVWPTTLQMFNVRLGLQLFSDSRSFRSPSDIARSSWPRSSWLAPAISTQYTSLHIHYIHNMQSVCCVKLSKSGVQIIGQSQTGLSSRTLSGRHPQFNLISVHQHKDNYNITSVILPLHL